jgi:hypothetical protein
MQRTLTVLFLTISRSANAGTFRLPLGGGYYLVTDDVFILMAVSIIAAMLVYYGFKGLYSVFDQPPPPPPTPQDYDEQAAQYRAKARMLEAKAGYDDSRAKAALKNAELNEVEQFVKQQNATRSGSNASRR